jgi:carboxypeptidase T
MRNRLLSGAVILLLVSLVPVFPSVGTWPAASATPLEGPVVVRIEFETPEQLRALAATLDTWEVDHEEGTLVAAVNAEGYQTLLEMGYRLEIDEELTRTLNQPNVMLPGQTTGIPGYPCYRTVEETFQTATDLASSHPNLAAWIDVGNSWEKTEPGGNPGYDMGVLCLTNTDVPGPKPKLFVMSAIHAREYTTAELVTRFAEYLVDNYGLDADLTWLLDYHEIHLMLQSNPDGRKKAETGLYWRKNTNENYCSPTSNDRGADLNRNYPFQWACCGGSSSYECAETYHGPYANSEPETQAVVDYVTSEFPDQREDDLVSPAPDDAMGVFLDIHSYSRLVLWPWGFTGTPAPNSTQLQTLGRKFAYFNGYTPQEAMSLYPTDGTTDDWAYGRLGLASYCFELGTAFFQDCSSFESIILPDNMDALLYAAKVARTPYMTAAGPDALAVTATPDDVLAGQPIQLTATIDDTRYNNSNGTEPSQKIVAAEYYVDIPPWATSASPVAHPMGAVDGAFDEEIEAVEATVSTATLAPGRHIVYVRGRDLFGNWGPVSAVFVETDVDSHIDGHVSDAATALPVSAADVVLEGAAAYDATTDGAGYYHVPVLSGIYTVTASAFGYDPQVVTGVEATTGVTTTQDLALAPQPTGTVAGSVLELGTNVPLAAHLVVEGTPVEASANASGAYSLTLPAGVYTITARAPGHESRSVPAVPVAVGQTTPLDVLLPTPACVLLVDDDYGGSLTPDYQAYYTVPLSTLGIDYDVWSVQEQGFPTVDDLGSYPALLWFTGDVRYGTLNLSEQTALREYLMEGGGGLFLSGQEIAVDIAGDPGDFLGTVLHAGFVADDAGVITVEGQDLFSGLTFSLAGGEGADNQDSPDVISALPGATPVLSYTDEGLAGVAVDAGNYRSLFASFGMEGVASAADRAWLLADGLSWLGCSPAPVDLRIVKRGQTSPVLPGDLLTYTLALTNSSGIPLSGLLVTDTLPAELDFVSASPPATPDGVHTRWPDLSLASEGMLQLSLVAEVRGSVPLGSLIRNAEYGALASQMSAPVRGTQVVETPVGAAGAHRLYLPLILRAEGE